ncbi:F-BAR domain only protein 2 isoform X8 [Anopheles gambiae]|uniref:F-BAR domain only protein 2 isoform X7 n=1 Tax=Anopheles coluzzii TaxID=1518534 RepID=UPI0020FFA299|nr:F-BAR domain only protein 2 isoform X7 [Anopheles coluzzii]XP_061507975.1 F-BAR domain only protein 2 isoform X8 [Anopheles gambiae]XP_061507976.1 F-BAR domain only protein 2 isoform X8 [Anopheles gambiae]XP_061507977.1 F-BAR domain only protein 2 isoform X8 [Anopheles gambiae]XP_061507978.1 F-BAR domain only protein 2 isoform X8 [Anopheles gambiae]XP_061507979.1 F-BAR domain only protein 2 isoform X8 [Anopheles gambiae]
MTVDFNDYFWGEKNNGYEVLYQNMKYGLSATKELAEYFRERSNLEEYNSKLLTKLANKAGSSGGGTFSPLWIILKSTTERLSELHAQKVQKLTELVKNVTKYAEDLHKKHKSVKEEESGTQDAVQAMKESTAAVAKAKDTHNARLQEVEKARKDNSAKEIEKSEAKLRKHQDDYKALVEKHNIIKQEFEKKMTITCRRFQEMEEAHLKQMKEFLSSYMDIVQNNFDLVGQVHSDLKRQFLELTVDKLLEQFVLNKYTGLEKPELIELDFESGTASGSGAVGHNSGHQLLVNTSAPLPPGGSISPAPSSLAGGGLLESPTLSATSSSQPINIGTAPGKKESSHLRSWFSSSSTAAVPTNSPVNLSTSPTSTSMGGGGGRWGDGGTDLPSAQQQPHPASLRAMSPVPSVLNESSVSGSAQISGFLRSRREKAKSKKAKKKKDSTENSSAKDENILDGDSKGDTANADSATNLQTTSAISASNVAPTATPEVDEDGYSIQPRETTWDSATITEKSNNFYSSSDSDSEDEREEKKIHVEIKPLNNGAAPISASVDELRATVENLSLSPIGILTSQQQQQHHQQHQLHHQLHHQQQQAQPASQAHALHHQMSVGNASLLNNSNAATHLTSPNASNASTPTTVHPYAPLQSPTLSMSTSSNNRYADLGDIFSEVGDISISAPTSANLTKLTQRQIPTPTSAGGSSIAIPRPPSRRSEAAGKGAGEPCPFSGLDPGCNAVIFFSSTQSSVARDRVSPASQIARADSVGSLEFRSPSVGIGSSRGPSPLTIGMSDTIPLAVAFHEIIHAYFKGADESRCQVKMSGDMMISFPAGIVNVLTNNPNPAKLGFRIKNLQNLDNVLPNKQLITIDRLQSTSFSTTLEFNMPVLTATLRRQSEQNPNAPHINVDILKYQIKAKPGAASCPFQLVSYWKCEQRHTDIKIDYKYNCHAMAQPSPLLNVSISVPVDGGVKNVQSKPHSAWQGESNRLVWNFTDISQHSESGGVDTLRARLEVGTGPSTPAIISTQFNCEGTTLSGIEFELAGSGYRLSLVKRRFVSGKYICEGDGIRTVKTPTPPNVSGVMSPIPFGSSSSNSSKSANPSSGGTTG